MDGIGMLALALSLALAFAFLNGFHDSASIVAVAIASRAMTPRQALMWTALGEFVGPFVLGVAVAQVVGAGLVSPEAISLAALAAAVGGAVLWGVLTWWWGMPSSSSHALVGGLVGAALAAAGPQAVQWRGLAWVLAALFLSPLLGFGAGFGLTRVIFFLAQGASPRINRWFRGGQWLTTLGLALGHGANDGQKSMGLLALAWLLAGRTSEFQVTPAMMGAVATALALGASIGGWRLIRTVGGRILRVRPVHGFVAQLGSAAVIVAAAWAGAPISTTQVINSAIMGTGAAERWSKVRWRVARDMALAWLLTIPSSALLAAGLYALLSRWG
ncbi:MAG: inorganic phosphate transporter [Chloroflexi bacterium]|nr:inorganic phosphate transporter [Chloroflexota bacterium]